MKNLHADYAFRKWLLTTISILLMICGLCVLAQAQEPTRTERTIFTALHVTSEGVYWSGIWRDRVSSMRGERTPGIVETNPAFRDASGGFRENKHLAIAIAQDGLLNFGTWACGKIKDKWMRWLCTGAGHGARLWAGFKSHSSANNNNTVRNGLVR